MVVEYFVRNLHHYDFLKSRTEFGQAYNLIFVPQGRFSHATIELLLLQKQSDLGLRCLSRPSWQVTSVQNFRTSTLRNRLNT